MSKYLTFPPDRSCRPPVPHLAIGLHVCVVAGRPQPAVERRLRHPHEVERRREDLRYERIFLVVDMVSNGFISKS